MKTIEEYVKGKKNALTTKSARLVWVEDKIRVYTAEAQELKDELKNDVKHLEQIDAMVLELNEKKKALDATQDQLAGLSAEDVPAAVQALIESRNEVTELEAKIRSKYYAR